MYYFLCYDNDKRGMVMKQKLFTGKSQALCKENYDYRKKLCQLSIIEDYIDYNVIHDIYLALNKVVVRKKFFCQLSVLIECQTFVNSASILLLEIVLASFLKKASGIYFKIRLNLKKNDSIEFNIYQKSYLHKLLNRKINFNEFIIYVLNEKRNVFLLDGLFRWHLNIDGTNDTDEVSLMATEMETFLKNENINEDLIDQIIEITSELSSNACEHTSSDCYVFCCIEDGVNRQNNEKSSLVEIVILNFSNSLLYSHLKNDFVSSNAQVFNKIQKAYEYHKNYFGENYDENCFFIVSAFQNGVTTRKDNGKGTGGTGLTKFIQTVQPMIKDDLCHFITGNYLIMLDKKIIGSYNDEIGFNNSGSYLNDVPDTDFFNIQNYSLNGTLYSILLEVDRRR